tara:strand:- start:101 stop:490 length:390 start_codon:yes stop_codon:yes gene_type:complete
MGQNVERKLAAIMFTDIAGYTAQMSKDETVAINMLNKKESILKPLISNHNGTYVKGTGDGSLSYFNSAVDAAMCAKNLQESIYDDKNCLKSSYNKTLQHASYMKPTFKKNYLNLPLPKRIITEYNKVFK